MHSESINLICYLLNAYKVKLNENLNNNFKLNVADIS